MIPQWEHGEKEAEKGDWSGPADVKKRFRTADFVGKNRVIFDIGGNKFRLIVAIKYSAKIVFVRFVGTHKEYDQVDPETV